MRGGNFEFTAFKRFKNSKSITAHDFEGMTMSLGSDESVVVVQDLHKAYSLGSTIVRALNGVSLELKQGEFLVVMGPSGSGKSTLVNMIGGIDKPDSGSILVTLNEGNAVHLNELSPKELTRFRRQNVGFVFQFYSLIPTLTASENVELAAELIDLSNSEMKKRTKEVLEAVGLGDRLDSFPSQLSGGERQIVALARALVKRPKLLIVDEPTGQLDEKTGHEMVQLIRSTSEQFGSTVVMVTHDVSLKKYGDRVIHLSSGMIVKEESND